MIGSRAGGAGGRGSHLAGDLDFVSDMALQLIFATRELVHGPAVVLHQHVISRRAGQTALNGSRVSRACSGAGGVGCGGGLVTGFLLCAGCGGLITGRLLLRRAGGLIARLLLCGRHLLRPGQAGAQQRDGWYKPNLSHVTSSKILCPKQRLAPIPGAKTQAGRRSCFFGYAAICARLEPT